MAYYVPSTLATEHTAARASCAEYDKLCSNYDGPDMSAVDPASLDGVYQEQIEPYFTDDLFDAAAALPNGKLKKLIKLHLASATLDLDYLRSVMNNTSEELIIRLYAICELMGGNDTIDEARIKAHEPGTMHEDEFAQISELFFSLYAGAPALVKQDDMISLEYLVCHCQKMRWLWYPLGDWSVLEDIYNFVNAYESEHNSDIAKLRCDREIHFLAAWYRWGGKYAESLAMCDHIINRPKYKYTYNVYRIVARADKALIYLEQFKPVEAANELKKNISDYNIMKQLGDFKSLNVDSYYENSLFLVYLLKTYDILEALTDRNFDVDRANLVRSRSGADIEAKIKKLDIHDYRHQWKEFCTNLRKRMKYYGYIDYVKLFL